MSNSRILPEFELLVPKTMAEAVEMAAQYGDKAAILAGGTDLMIMLQKGMVGRAYVIGLGEIPDLDYITYSKTDGLRIGALVTAYQLIQNAKVKKSYTALWQAASTLGSPQIRNSATIVGNILRASPSGDCCCAMLALGGGVVLESVSGRREVPIDEFFLGYRKIARREGEIAVELHLPPLGDEQRSSFARMTRMNFDLAKVSASVLLDMNGKKCREARIAMGAVAPTPVRIAKAEDMLADTTLNEKTLAEVAAIIPKQIKPIDDVRSTAEYRRAVSGILVKRALQAACA